MSLDYCVLQNKGFVRQDSILVQVGNVLIGNRHPIVIQSHDHS